MQEAAYEILALLMRYVFAGLGLLICIRAIRWLLRDHRAHARERRQLPHAGQIGVLEYTDTGERLPLAPEGLVGAWRGCDVVIRKRGLRQKQFTYRFQPRRGVEIIPCRRAKVHVNGQPARSGQYALSGALIQAGDVTMRLRLFKRLKLPTQDVPSAESPDPLLSAWEEDDFLPNGMGIPVPETDEADDDFPDEDEPQEDGTGKILHMPLFSNDPPGEDEP